MDNEALMRIIDERLRDLGLSERKACITAGLQIDTIRRMRHRGQKARPDILAKLAVALRIPATRLLEAAALADPGAALSRVGEAIARPLQSVSVLGHVQAGDWREAFEWPSQEWYGITMVDDGRYPGIERVALEVRGDSMDMLYPDGSIVVIVRFGDIGRGPSSGERVVTIRRNDNGLYEATLKEFQEDAQGRQWLMPRSSNPEHRPLLLTSEPASSDVPSHALPLVAQARSLDDGSEPDIALFGLVVQSTRLE